MTWIYPANNKLWVIPQQILMITILKWLQSTNVGAVSNKMIMTTSGKGSYSVTRNQYRTVSWVVTKRIE